MEVNETLAADDSPSMSSVPDCPSCGSSVASMTVLGPTDGVVAPCGCRIAPDALESE
ncbi:hypothetical protein RBH26_01080 [Natronolimnohabitans sp. A-GB9]|uniref:hypothetical protein n=1 Tax=Natronolimnohabitans sp. A-GB9 TaxID=3069757 RepID=UPI0027ADF49D|nr:hypothetical protein [Natronolimnohabitans sp. A-GB9]MDQ2049068.1 hypothetical protein [Natronolimnohabitans sp. A-GB9]